MRLVLNCKKKSQAQYQVAFSLYDQLFTDELALKTMRIREDVPYIILNSLNCQGPVCLLMLAFYVVSR